MDWKELNPDSDKEWPEDIIQSSVDDVIKIIDEEVNLGIPDDRIIVGR
jgi:hypothetical protein